MCGNVKIDIVWCSLSWFYESIKLSVSDSFSIQFVSMLNGQTTSGEPAISSVQILLSLMCRRAFRDAINAIELTSHFAMKYLNMIFSEGALCAIRILPIWKICADWKAIEELIPFRCLLATINIHRTASTRLNIHYKICIKFVMNRPTPELGIQRKAHSNQLIIQWPS